MQLFRRQILSRLVRSLAHPHPTRKTLVHQPFQNTATLTSDPSPHASLQSYSSKTPSSSPIFNVQNPSSNSPTKPYRGRAWTSAEDERLREAVNTQGTQDWVRVSAAVGNDRDNRACRQRWLRISDSIRRGPFTAEEITRIRHLTKQYPKQWTYIAKRINTGRTGEQVRDLINERLNPSLSIDNWTEEEDVLLQKAVKKYGVGRWVEVAEMVPGRSDGSCLNRWTFSLAPGLIKGAWTEQEDQCLLLTVRTLTGLGEPFHFGQVAQLMHHTRHRKSCRARYDRLVNLGKAPKLKTILTNRGTISRFSN